jgi:hypothetical protein
VRLPGLALLFTSGHAHSSLHEHDSARIGESPQNTPSTTRLLRHLTALAGLAWSRRGFLRPLLVEEDHRWKRISQTSARSSTAFQAFIPERASRLTERYRYRLTSDLIHVYNNRPDLLTISPLHHHEAVQAQPVQNTARCLAPRCPPHNNTRPLSLSRPPTPWTLDFHHIGRAASCTCRPPLTHTATASRALISLTSSNSAAHSRARPPSPRASSSAPPTHRAHLCHHLLSRAH